MLLHLFLIVSYANRVAEPESVKLPKEDIAPPPAFADPKEGDRWSQNEITSSHLQEINTNNLSEIKPSNADGESEQKSSVAKATIAYGKPNYSTMKMS